MEIVKTPGTVRLTFSMAERSVGWVDTLAREWQTADYIFPTDFIRVRYQTHATSFNSRITCHFSSENDMLAFILKLS